MSKSIYSIFSSVFNLNNESGTLTEISLCIYRTMNKGYVLENLQGSKQDISPLAKKLKRIQPRGKAYKRMIKSKIIN